MWKLAPIVLLIVGCNTGGDSAETATPTITSEPHGITVNVDGQVLTTPAEFSRFLSVRDEAWRASLPPRVRFSESYDPGGKKVRKREVWIWDGKLQYLESTHARDEAGTLLSRRFGSFKSGRWFVGSTFAELRGEWSGTISRDNPSRGFEQTTWRLWHKPWGSFDLAELLRSHPVVEVEAASADVKIVTVAANQSVRILLERGTPTHGLLGWVIEVDGKRDWRPTRIDLVTGERPLENDSGSLSVPRVDFGRFRGVLSSRTTFSDWALLGSTWVPLRTEKKTYVYVSRARRGTITVQATATVVDDLPPRVTFASVCPIEFGAIGTVADKIRNIRETIDLTDGAEFLRRREELVDRSLEEAPKQPPPRWAHWPWEHAEKR